MICATIETILLVLLWIKDPYTLKHSIRVSKYVAKLARELGYSEDTVKVFQQAGLLHDVGKLKIPRRILRKRGPLSEREYSMIKDHTTYGLILLLELPFKMEILHAAYLHHERIDGRGYPKFYCEIPDVARIVTLADSFDAMYSDRPYRPGRRLNKCIEEVKKNSGTQFDPIVVEAFLKLVEKGEWVEKE